MRLFKNPNINFVRWRWPAMGLSALVIAAGVIVASIRGVPLGVEFSGGTIVIAQFERVPEDHQIRAALAPLIPGGGENIIVQRYGSPDRREKMIRVPQVGAEIGGRLSDTADAVVRALEQAKLGPFKVVGTEIVGPVIGRELTRKGITATVLALGGILIYIALRFQFSFAAGAVIATIHDLLVTLAFLVFFRYDLSLNVIAAILTITGYSVNDTIVIFDRVRENLRSMRRDALDHVINVSVNQTLSRTVITAGTALLSVLALYLFGGQVLEGFAFTMLVGIVTGTYSSVFIAAAIVTVWRRPPRARPAAAAATAPSAAARPRSKRPRSARAS